MHNILKVFAITRNLIIAENTLSIEFFVLYSSKYAVLRPSPDKFLTMHPGLNFVGKKVKPDFTGWMNNKNNYLFGK